MTTGSKSKGSHLNCTWQVVLSAILKEFEDFEKTREQLALLQKTQRRRLFPSPRDEFLSLQKTWVWRNENTIFSVFTLWSINTDSTYTLNQQLISYLNHIKRIYLHFQMRKICSSLYWWDCVLSTYSREWVSWQEQLYCMGYIPANCAGFQGPRKHSEPCSCRSSHFADVYSWMSPLNKLTNKLGM